MGMPNTDDILDPRAEFLRLVRVTLLSHGLDDTMEVVSMMVDGDATELVSKQVAIVTANVIRKYGVARARKCLAVQIRVPVDAIESVMEAAEAIRIKRERAKAPVASFRLPATAEA